MRTNLVWIYLINTNVCLLFLWWETLFIICITDTVSRTINHNRICCIMCVSVLVCTVLLKHSIVLSMFLQAETDCCLLVVLCLAWSLCQKFCVWVPLLSPGEEQVLWMSKMFIYMATLKLECVCWKSGYLKYLCMPCNTCSPVVLMLCSNA